MYRYLLVAALAMPVGAWAGDLSISGHVSVGDRNNSVDVSFSNRDQSAIADYYRTRERREGDYRDRERGRDDRYRRDRDEDDYGRGDRERDEGDDDGRGLPPGLARRGGHLPPGLARRDRLPPGLARNERLPEDVAVRPLPRDLEQRLSPLPRNYVRVEVGGDIVILDRRTHVVVDLMSLGGR